MMKCPYCKGETLVKAGIRKTKKGPIQRYRCTDCSRSASLNPDHRTQYPLKVMLHSMEMYNCGVGVRSITREIPKIYPHSPPDGTIYSWIERYRDRLTFLKIRSRFELDPDTIIKTKEFNHQQVIPFSMHPLKLNISAKKLPGLRRYIDWVIRSLPDRMFLEGPRASQTKINNDLVPMERMDASVEMCSLALERMSSKKSAHTSVEEFFLKNDDRTICTELPVFLNPSEIPSLNLKVPLTGHIDLVQVRYDKIWILDYKPNLNRPEEYSSQLYLYREALSRRTGIPKEVINLSAFNEHSSFIYQ